MLVLAEFERRLGLAERLARCIEDPRDPERVRHGLAEMVRFRALLIAAGYTDANNCDFLRTDPAFKLAVGQLSEEADLCSQPTMCRLENPPKPSVPLGGHGFPYSDLRAICAKRINRINCAMTVAVSGSRVDQRTAQGKRDLSGETHVQ